MSPSDQNTIGFSPSAVEHLAWLKDKRWFNTEVDACRVAMVLALKRGILARKEEMKSLTTKFNVGTFDRDGKVRQLLLTTGIPAGMGLYDYAERLIHAGLRSLAEELAVEGTLLSDVMASQSAPSGSATTSGID